MTSAKPQWAQPHPSHIPRSLSIETSEAETKQSQLHIPNGNAMRKTGKHPSSAAAEEQKGLAWLTPAPWAGPWTTNPCSSRSFEAEMLLAAKLDPCSAVWGMPFPARCLCLHYSRPGEIMRLLHQLALSSNPQQARKERGKALCSYSRVWVRR